MHGSKGYAYSSSTDGDALVMHRPEHESLRSGSVRLLHVPSW